MKKHQLLLLVLLFTSNGLLITQNSENIHSASFRNIEKRTTKKPNPVIHTNPASIKRIEKSVSKIPTELSCCAVLIAGIESYIGTAIASIFVQKSLLPSKEIVENKPLRVIMFFTGISYIFYRTINTQKTLRKIIANKEIIANEEIMEANVDELFVSTYCDASRFAGFMVALSGTGFAQFLRKVKDS